MGERSVRRQAAVLAGANAAVRGLGFLLHILLGRLLGAEALGVFELSHSAHLLAVTPVTAGLPAAVSRLTAVRGDDGALRAGRSLALRFSLVWVPLWLALSPLTAGLLGDPRTLLSLMLGAPSLAVLGVTAAYQGYCYGIGAPWPSALGTLTEQTARLGLTAALLTLPALTVAARAAVPAAAEALAGLAALAVMIGLLRRERALPAALADKPLRREVARLALPLTGARLVQTLSRALTAAILPRRLVAGGLAPTAATAAVGMLQGMVLPILMLPGIVTGAVGMAGTPAIARRQGKALRGMALRLYGAALACGLLGWAAVRLGAGVLAEGVYRLPELRELYIAAAPLALTFAMSQGAGMVLGGLGEQRKTLLPTVLGAAISLILTFRWASAFGIFGAIRAMLTGRAFTAAAETCLAAAEANLRIRN